jgi:hypothetical protein
MATQLSTKLARLAPPDLSAESVNFLIRERGIMDLAAIGCSRAEAKRILFLAWLVRRRDLEDAGEE